VTDKAFSPLRRRTVEDMTIRKLAPCGGRRPRTLNISGNKR
jgi:hypothetical protein